MSDIQTVIDRLSEAGLLEALLMDHTTGDAIIWEPGRTMELHEIVGPNPIRPILPRWRKAAEARAARTRKRAEVYTPSWVVGKMVGAIDTETPMDWPEYLRATWLEVTCGEGAYITTRYEMDSGAPIPEPERVGILDRKLRLLREHFGAPVFSRGIVDLCMDALRTVYGYEYQADSLLIARINVLLTIAEHIHLLTGRPINRCEAESAIGDIAHNLWQMDGLTDCIPGTDIPARITDWKNGREIEFRAVKGEDI